MIVQPEIQTTLMKTMSNHPPKIPRLLVSVRSRAEASSAVAGGCDILDLKEPNRGSLGMVDLKIAEEVVDFTNDVPLSLALGELSDWKQNKSFPLIPPGITYCKIGLSGQAAHSRWQQKWKHFRESVDESGSREHGWIAVIYADYQNAGAPAPEEVLEAATNTNCAGVLIDTFSKTAGNVFECLPLQDLSRFIAQIRSSGMLVALAGSVSLNHLPTILPLRPDIVAVRGSVCRDFRRTSEVQMEHVQQFKETLGQNSQNATLTRS